MKTHILLLISCTTLLAGPFNDGFAKRKTRAYIENHTEVRFDAGFEKVAGMTGKTCLRLFNENQEDAQFIPVPVQEGAQYELSFRSKFVNGETLETNPTLERTAYPGWKQGYKHLPTFELSFLDKNRKSVRGGSTVAIPFGEWSQIKRTFIVPPDAAFIRVVFASGINTGKLYIDNVRFKATGLKTGYAMRFQGGKYDWSGWQSLRDNAGMMTFNGKRYFNTEYGSTTETFKMKPGRASFLLTGVAHRKYPVVVVSYFDQKMKRVGKETLKSPANQQKSLTAPPNTAFASILIYNHLIEELKVTQP